MNNSFLKEIKSEGFVSAIPVASKDMFSGRFFIIRYEMICPDSCKIQAIKPTMVIPVLSIKSIAVITAKNKKENFSFTPNNLNSSIV